jgi:hypothetical protein
VLQLEGQETQPGAYCPLLRALIARAAAGGGETLADLAWRGLLRDLLMAIEPGPWNRLEAWSLVCQRAGVESPGGWWAQAEPWLRSNLRARWLVTQATRAELALAAEAEPGAWVADTLYSYLWALELRALWPLGNVSFEYIAAPNGGYAALWGQSPAWVRAQYPALSEVAAGDRLEAWAWQLVEGAAWPLLAGLIWNCHRLRPGHWAPATSLGGVLPRAVRRAMVNAAVRELRRWVARGR